MPYPVPARIALCLETGVDIQFAESWRVLLAEPRGWLFGLAAPLSRH